MGNARKFSTLLAAAGFMVSGAAQAALHDRGGGLLYDDVLKVTWLQDANYAKTSGYDADGLMNWYQANTWTSNLVYHDSVRGVDYDDWRLPRNSPVGSDWNYAWSHDGSTDFADNITSPNSELAYMYYVNLGLKAAHSPSGVYQPDWGIFGNGTLNGINLSWYGQNDVGLVKNLQSEGYWYGTTYGRSPDTLAWYMYLFGGNQAPGSKSSSLLSVWAVRPGDVAAVAVPVPEPETYAMFLAGLAVMGGALGRRAGKAG